MCPSLTHLCAAVLRLSMCVLSAAAAAVVQQAPSSSGTRPTAWQHRPLMLQANPRAPQPRACLRAQRSNSLERPRVLLLLLLRARRLSRRSRRQPKRGAMLLVAAAAVTRTTVLPAVTTAAAAAVATTAVLMLHQTAMWRTCSLQRSSGRLAGKQAGRRPLPQRAARLQLPNSSHQRPSVPGGLCCPERGPFRSSNS